MPWGLYKFNVMHYGFINVPACLQHYMDHILLSLIYKQLPQVTVYMGDIRSFAKDMSEAIQHNRKSSRSLEGSDYIVKHQNVTFTKMKLNCWG